MPWTDIVLRFHWKLIAPEDFFFRYPVTKSYLSYSSYKMRNINTKLPEHLFSVSNY